jgi:dTDP-4-amino-4,6-dideoxygalactose transaminase
LANIKNPKIILPQPGGIKENVWHLFVIRSDDRQKLHQFLTVNEILTLIHYPIAPHQQECYSGYNFKSFPITELIHREVLSLPMSPVMVISDVQRLVDVLNNF